MTFFDRDHSLGSILHVSGNGKDGGSDYAKVIIAQIHSHQSHSRGVDMWKTDLHLQNHCATTFRFERNFGQNTDLPFLKHLK